ncbi:MAG: H-NS histone family protein [Xanthomonadaceae bacterium]|nr:H-NS histone family protein [Xanthomonadaceae bacterium]
MIKQIDFESMSVEEIESVIASASREIEKRRLADAKKIKKQIKRLLDDSGLSFDDVFEERNPRKGRKVPPKYQNPDNPEEKWSGRGKMPVWMREKVEAGADREDFLIEDND